MSPSSTPPPAPRDARPLAPHGARLPWSRVDLVGDVHGCLGELRALVERLGYGVEKGGAWRHPEGRRLVFVGDLVDRGPDSLGTLDAVAPSVAAGTALLVRGNHDDKLRRWLEGANVQRRHGLAETVAEYARYEGAARDAAKARHHALLAGAPLWALLDPEGEAGTAGAPRAHRLVVAHAAWHPGMLDAAPGKARAWALFGPTDGQEPGGGRPRRLDWTRCYPADAPFCVVGHTAYDGPVVARGATMCIDTGCAFGGRLTALRWPERELVQVEAERAWYPKEDLGPAPALIDPAAVGPEAVRRVCWGRVERLAG